jgi:RNA polymerase sigma-70 factor (ECF subfamily)
MSHGSEATEGLTERGLVADLKDGDESAYAVLFHEMFADLRGHAYLYVRQWDDATEIAQQVFVNLFLRRHELRDGDKMRVYLHSAVRNEARNARRARRVREKWAGRVRERLWPASRETAGVAMVAGRELEAQLARLIDRLPAKCREAFSLVRVHGLTYDEAGEVMGVMRSTIATHVVRATRILGKQLVELGLVDGGEGR